MTLSKSTRTHLIYQFIILTILFLCIGYHELSTERKYIMYLAFIPMFCYQLVILSCCTELLPVPKWMVFCDFSNKTGRKAIHSGTGSLGDLSDLRLIEGESFLQHSRTEPNIYETNANISNKFKGSFTRFVNSKPVEKRNVTQTRKSISHMNLKDFTKEENSDSRSLNFGQLTNSSNSGRKEKSVISGMVLPETKKVRARKAMSWENETVPHETFRMKSNMPSENSNFSSVKANDNLESQVEKSYSFPFRQKRLEKWSELKENLSNVPNTNVNMPYWETVGYNLAVKYEARRRKRALSGPTGLEVNGGESKMKHNFDTKDLSKSTENTSVLNRMNFPWKKKNVYKSSVARMNKIKEEFSNFISKNRKDETIHTQSRDSTEKASFFQEKFNPDRTAKEFSLGNHQMPLFLSEERPFIFYPKYIPFERERFEKDVRHKMLELNKT